MATYNLPPGFADCFSISSNYSQEGRHRLVEFGDGYIQRTPLGINAVIRRLNVQWENLTTADRDTLLATLDYVHYTGDALYIPADELNRYEGKYMIEALDVQMADNERVTISASLREVFDL